MRDGDHLVCSSTEVLFSAEYQKSALAEGEGEGRGESPHMPGAAEELVKCFCRKGAREGRLQIKFLEGQPAEDLGGEGIREA